MPARHPLRAVLTLALAALLLACDDEANPDPTTATTTVTESPTPTAAQGGGGVAWEQCPFVVPQVDLECGALEVPANREDPAAGTITIRFGIARAPQAAADPLVYLAGGPGQAALEFVPLAWDMLYAPLAEGRDLVILDQRGTGFSEPTLFCDEYSLWARNALATNAPTEEQQQGALDALEACRQRLVGQGVDFGNFTSAESAADLEDLRAALGYDQWNLYGNSYGTRLALTAMRDHPDGIRSVVLDAAYPIEANLYEAAPANASRALEAFFATCADDTACAEAFGDLEQTVRGLVDRLNAEPATITVADPLTGQRTETRLTGDGLAGFLFQSLYATELIPFLPEAIAAAERGDYGIIGYLEGAFVGQVDLVSLGMQLAVQCNEEIPFTDADAVAAAAAEYPLIEGFLEAAPTLGPGVVALCEGWRGDDPDPEENDPITSDIPTLVLTGSLDPVTPPAWGEEVAQGLEAAHVFEFPYTGHGVVAARECGAAMTQAFLADPTTAPDDACIQDIPEPAFTPSQIAPELAPFTTPDGIEGVAPEGWLEVVPGVFQESPLVSLTHLAVPGTTEAQILEQLSAITGVTASPEPSGTLETRDLTWSLYELRDLGLAVDLAVTEWEGTLYLVQLAAPPMRRDAYYSEVFEPAVREFVPPADPVPPFPGGTPSPTPVS